MKKALRALRHFFHGCHGGRYVGTGHIDVIAKRNKDPEKLPGYYPIFRCGYCEELYTPQPLRPVDVEPHFPIKTDNNKETTNEAA